MTLQCVLCGRRIKRAAAVIEAELGGSAPHPPGPVGPVCALRAGLVRPKPALFSRKKRVARAKAPKVDRQLALVLEVVA
jgi:hypothetical protein